MRRSLTATIILATSQAMAQTSTTTTLTTSLNAYVAGTAVTAQAIISNNAATGTMVLKDGATTIATGSVTTFYGTGNPGGNQNLYAGANFAGVSFPAGTHSLTAVYSGDGTYGGSTSTAYIVVVSAVATSPQPISAMSLGLNGAPNGFVPSPNDAYHQRIDGLPADPNSVAVITEMSSHANHFHMDLGFDGNTYYGIPYNVVDSGTIPGLPLTVQDDGEQIPLQDSDIFTRWPGSSCLHWIEGHYGSNCDPTLSTITGDNHYITIVRDMGIAYEGYRAQMSTSAIQAVNTAAVDLTSLSVPQAWPITTTRADAAGLPLFEGLLGYDEALAGPPPHAIRMTTDQMGCDNYSSGDCQPVFHLPLTHQAQVPQHMTNNTVGYGSRFRLKASFSCASLADQITQNVCITMQRYGIIEADLGSALYLSGTPDARWQNTHILDLQSVMSFGSNWEMVEATTPYAPNRYPTGAAAAVTSFAASSTSVTAGTPVTLTSNTTNASYSYIDAANAYLRGNSNTTTVTPTQTTTYTLSTKNANLNGNGAVNSQSITINVTGLPCFLCGNLTVQGNFSQRN